MNGRDVSRSALQEGSEIAIGILAGVAQILRWVLFSVLAVCAPVVRCVLSLISVSFFLTCGFYALAAPHSKFPQLTILGIATGFAFLLVIYELILKALEP